MPQTSSTLPSSSAAPVRVRPKLFGDPQASAPTDEDEGHSILASIEGHEPQREPRRSRSARRSLTYCAVALAMLGAAYAGVQALGARPGLQGGGSLAIARAAPDAAAATLHEDHPASPSQRGAPAAGAVDPVDANKAQGMAAVIESVPPVARPQPSAATPFDVLAGATAVAPASLPASSVPSSPAPLQVATPAAAQPVVTPSASQKASPKTAKPTRQQEAGRTASSSAPVARKSPPSAELDNDAALLAAMLPYLHRSPALAGTAPRSAAFDKRCGGLQGTAFAQCRVTFCEGLEGRNAACPP